MKILIIGLRDKETAKLVNSHPDLKLSFIDSSSITSKSLKGINSYAHILNVCKFSSHLVEYTCNRHKGFIRLRPTQGYSTVNAILKGLYAT